MKKFFLAAFLVGSAFLVCAQMTLSSGSQIVVASGSTLVVNNVVSDDGLINNAGIVEIRGHVENNTTGLMNPASNGTVVFNGTSAQEITGDADAEFYGTVQISNSSGVSIKTSTGHSQTINGTLDFANGLLTLNEYDLTVTAGVTSCESGKYVQTNDDGALKMVVAATGVVFPVGNATYNPATLTNDGTSDTYGVVAKDGLPSGFTSSNHAVNRYWDISEAVGGESDLTVQAQWSTNTTPSNEQASFARAASCMGYTANDGATVSWGSIGAATGGSDDWLCSQTGYTQDLSTASSFFVADDYFKGYNLNLQVWLSGPYNATNDDMDNNLNIAGGGLLIPLIDPFDDGVTTTVGSIHADIVDWVKIELRASDRTASRKVYHAFVNTSGNVVDYNNNPLMASEVDFSLTDYSVAIIHRNHFGIVSNANDINLRTTSGTDFKLLTNAYDDGTVTYPLAPLDFLETGAYGLWTGDVNNDGQIVYNEANSDREVILTAVGGSSTMTNIVTDQYSASDLNMDRDVIYNEANSDRELILTNVGGSSTMTRIAHTHLPN